MKFNVQKVTEFLSQWFDLEEFYSLSFSRFSVNLQGKYKSELIKETRKAIGDAEEEIDENGFISFSFEFEGIQYRIVFTG